MQAQIQAAFREKRVFTAAESRSIDAALTRFTSSAEKSGSELLVKQARELRARFARVNSGIFRD